MSPPSGTMTQGAQALGREAWLEIDLDAVRHNVGVMRNLLGDGVSMAPVVKADGYGHGMIPVATALADVADAFCVATIDEGLALRAAGITGRIILLYPVPAEGVGDAIEARLELTLMCRGDLRTARAIAASSGRQADVQIAVETGMHRGGFRSDGADDVVAAAGIVNEDPNLRLTGIWSHLMSPGDAISARNQALRFDAAIAAIRAAGITPAARHLAASEGIFAATVPSLELVRPGLATYGVLDDALDVAESARHAAADLRPAMDLKAHAVAFSHVPAGGTVGYGGRWRAEEATTVAILPVGYGDGYQRVTNGAEVLLRGRRWPLVGVISMDAVAVDLGADVSVGHDEEFVLLGPQGDDRISAPEMARWRNTIAWEVLSGMSSRLARVYNRPTG